MNRCYWCNKELLDNEIALDHYFPRRYGGKLKDNLVISCKSCNSSKHSNFWFKKDNKTKKYKKPKQLLKFEKTEDGHELAIITTIFIIKGKYKKIKNEMYEKYGKEIQEYLA